MSPEFSFIIATRKEDPEILNATINGIRSLGGPEVVEIIVVDDATHNWGNFPKRPDVLAVKSAKRLGIAKARNLGVSHATGRTLVFTDAHVVFSSNILDVLRSSGVAEGDGIRGCETGIISGVDTLKLGLWGGHIPENKISSRYLGWKLDLTGFPRCWPVKAGTRFNDHWQDVPYAGGCCLAISRALFDDLGGFAACLVGIGSGGDLELAIRCHAIGLPVRSTNSAACYHLTENKVERSDYRDPVICFDLGRYPGSTANMCRVVLRYLSASLALRKCREIGFTPEQIEFLCNGDGIDFRWRMESIRQRATIKGEQLIARLTAGEAL